MKVYTVDTLDSISDKWMELCAARGYFFQSSYYDQINSIFNTKPYFIYITNDNGILLGGCKISLNESHKLPAFIRSISRTAMQYGEYVLALDLSNEERTQVIQLITQSISGFIKEKNITKFNVKGVYGDESLLYYSPKFNSIQYFDIATINLTQSLETLWNNIHSKHRNKIRKAEKDGVQIVCDDDFDTLKKLLFETYAAQPELKLPNEVYLNKYFEIISGLEENIIYKAYYNNEVTGAALILRFGTLAEYTFTGSNKLHTAANNLMQWYIIQDLKAKGYHRYSLGPVARENEIYNNAKFEDGITSYKKRFGGEVSPIYYAELIVSPLKNKIWKSVVRWLNKK